MTSDESQPGFAHDSERETANLLDFYGIKWEYEPRTFPIAWNSLGQETQSFTPDFYLPEFDIFVEITVQNQKLVTKKNRKLRRLKALYPHINAKIFYKNDLRDLAHKHGMRGSG